MQSVFIAFSIALLLTSVSAFRFSNGRRPLFLTGYFLVFFSLEWLLAHFILPPDVFGLEIAWVCLGLTVPFVIGIVLTERYERGLSGAEGGQESGEEHGAVSSGR